MSEKIIAAALMLENGSVITEPPPARHCDLFSKHHNSTMKDIKVVEQGFILDQGRIHSFVTRKDAWKIAEREGQLIKQNFNNTKGTLYTEDLW